MPQLLQILVDVADAMAYLHPDIVHRDLKSQNGAQPHMILDASCFLCSPGIDGSSCNDAIAETKYRCLVEGWSLNSVF